MSLTDDLNQYMPAATQKTIQFAYDLFHHCDGNGGMYLIALGLAKAVLDIQLEANLDETNREEVEKIVAFLKDQFEQVHKLPLSDVPPEGELN